ncbi:hypothetical protein QTP88_017256 [Uroleucon formosanum]
MVFGGETAKAAASEAVVSEIQGVRVGLGSWEQGRLPSDTEFAASGQRVLATSWPRDPRLQHAE